LLWLTASLCCSLVNGLAHRSDSSDLASQHAKESSRVIKLSVNTIDKLDALKGKLQLKDADYEDVVGYLLGKLEADGKHEVPQHQSHPPVISLGLNGTQAVAKEEVAQKQAGCLFDDQMFGMNPAMKLALQAELNTGPLALAVKYVKDHPNEGWMHCAMKGAACPCTGRVRFGEHHWLGPKWSEPINVASTVMCEPAPFTYTLSQPNARSSCQCAWDSELLHQPSIQLRFNSWSYAQEAWIFMLRTLAQAKWLPWSGDRNLHGSTLFAARGGGIFDRVWINKWLDTVGQEYVAKHFGTKPLNCLEWDPIFYQKKFSSCAQAAYTLSYVPEPEKMRVEGKTIYADILKLPQVAKNLKMDLVVATQVWEHLDHPVDSVKALYESMNPGGVLLFAVPFKAPFHGAPEDYWRYTKSGVVEVLEQGGFCVPRSAMASGGDFIYSIGLNAGISAGDFSKEELLQAYFRGFDKIPDGPLEVFAVGLKKKLPTDICPP
jgi:SAM-dependent methyltransferase